MSTHSASTLHPCARCACMQKTCCQRAEVLVTRGDLGRIESHLARPDAAQRDELRLPAPFHERRRPEDPDYLDQDDDPLWLRATVAADGTRRVLRRRENGDCVFLGQAGCVLPEDVRPLVCRIYPFAYTEAGLTDEDPDYCPTEILVPGGGSMAKVLGMQRRRAEDWRQALYAELREEVSG